MAERRGECPAVPAAPVSNSPDGPVVEKGGQAYVGRGAGDYAVVTAASRRVKTTDTALCGGDTGIDCALADFNRGNPAISAALLGVVDDSDRGRYIDWARGSDTENEDGDDNRFEFRPSLHGDVIHSRPVAVDYSLDPQIPQVVVFYGGNDGLLRAINGSRSSSHNAAGSGPEVAAGGEFWSFLLPEYFSSIGRALRDVGREKLYGADGPLTAWESTPGRRYLAMGLRRGGRTAYGMDVSDIAVPKLVWRLGCTTPPGDNSGCAPGWEGIGETWSAMQPAFVPGREAPYLIMGGGYDHCEDHHDPVSLANHRCDSGTRGNVIYVLDAATGAIINSFATDRAGTR